MGQNKIEEVDNLEDTMVFDVKDLSTKELNVIKEKNEVVDFTSPVEVLSDIDENKKAKKVKKDKSSSPKKDKKKINIFSKLITWWTGLSLIKRIISILIPLLVLSLILVLVFKKDKKDTKPKSEDVIFEADNYRYKNGTLVFLGDGNKELGKYTCNNKDEKKCFVAYLNNEDDFTGTKYLNQAGEKIKFRSKIIDENYVFVVDNKKGSEDDIILYSIKSKSNVDEYKLVKQVNSNKNVVVLKDKDNKYGVIDLSEATPKVLINFVYNYAGIIDNEMGSKYIVLEKNDKYYVADYTEKLLSGGLNNKIVEYNDNFIVTKDSENKYKIYNYDGNELKDGSFLFIKLIDIYYAVLQDNGLYVFDKEGLKYNETPIPLSSTNYNKTNVYDANNQLISSDIAFEAASEDDYVSITRGKAIDALSIKEAQANKMHPIFSYYNGILYFYKDTTKTNVLGKYTCKNKNTPGQFDHCTIAASTSFSKNDMTSGSKTGFISLINNRYVFVRDTLSSGGIYLYDLSQSKKLGPYNDVEAIDLVSDNESYKNINGAYVIAKNNKNLYGLLRINNSSVDVALGFDYSEMEKEGDYFLVKKSNGKYSLYNNSINEVVKDIDSKIVAYNDNYITAKSNQGYNIYKHNGTKLDEKTYSYIKLESNYYVGISSNNLGIYKYNNPGVNLLKVNIPIKSSEGTKYNSLFKINASSLGYEVSITDGENDKTYLFDSEGNEVIVP